MPRTLLNPPSSTYRPPIYDARPGNWPYEVTENLLIESGYRIGAYTTAANPTLTAGEQTGHNYFSLTHDGTTTPSSPGTPITPTDPQVEGGYLQEVVIPITKMEPAKTTQGHGKKHSDSEKRHSRGSGSTGSLPSWAYDYYTTTNQTSQENIIEDSPTTETSTTKEIGITQKQKREQKRPERPPSPQKQPSFEPTHRTLHKSEPVTLCSYGSILFLFGFILPPLWWLGSLYPKDPSTSYDRQWLKYNRLMSVLSFLLIGLVLGMLIWYRYGNNTTD